ncbi:MAG: glutamine synthetase III [Chlamydiales bacterium]|nr:glutamine synthetase III [Chlamydiales bacterium]
MNSRENAIRTITDQMGQYDIRGPYIERQAFEAFGENAFNEEAQRQRLSLEVFQALQRTIKMGAELDQAVANSVAVAMKDWALEKGVTHFCHWFQPLTDLTAEKHDSFFSPASNGKVITEFNGKMLILGEPDASSFPSGGLRTTFEARGYTAWDPSSPAFILGRTLVIPTFFLSWHGDALDKKTPLLRSMEALNKQALRILALFGDETTKRVVPTVGAEQEYFLIDSRFYNLRPDIICCGRTLFGARPSRGQELEDQYLSSIPDRILAVMEEVEFELLRLGVPIKTRHNEVAPSQYELALTFEAANLASDHHMLVMDILKKVANRKGMSCLLHEKPFAGINGSGKHNNWSLATDDGINLLEPGETPHENARFLLFCAAVVRAVHKYAPLLRMSIASAGNDHRLGVHEAPPAIISVFLGDQLFQVFQGLINGETAKGGTADLMLGVSMLPRIPRHSSDRNRTSPFAFTGNKFEFRAVGSSENIAKPITVLNTIIAESLDFFATELEKAVESGKEFNQELQKLLASEAESFQPILYEGDNYSEAWYKEAQKRGLPNIRDAVNAFEAYTSPESVALFTKYKVFTRRELVSRQEISLSKYVKKILIEAKIASQIAHTMILPAALRHIRELGETLLHLHNGDQELLKVAAKEVSGLRKSLKALDDLIEKMPTAELHERALYLRDRVLPALTNLRSHVDKLEFIVSDKYWPIPKYQEMLFIR